MMRFKSTGPITNFEIGGLRKEGVWRGIRWQHLWASLSDTIHPKSKEEWQAYMRSQESDSE